MVYNIKERKYHPKKGEKMKILHISDLHIGKKLNGFSMLENQEHMLYQVLDIVDAEKPEAVVIAGDVYDKSIPPTEAISIFDDFLVKLSQKETKTMIISGNHDSAERLAFGNRLIERSGVYISPVYSGQVKPVVIDDEFGQVNFYMLPFVKPAHVRRFYEDKGIENFTDAIRVATEEMHIDESQRNVLVAHQFITNAEKSESEEMMVGGLENVDASSVEAFDSVALGHIHKSQTLGKGNIRYCGTPLKYSFSEKDQVKSVTLVEMGQKGDVSIREIPLRPLIDLREIKGTFEELTSKEYYSQDYLRIVLTDDDYVTNAMAKLRQIYPNVMILEYDNKRTRSAATVGSGTLRAEKGPLDNFKDLFTTINGKEMSAEQEKLVQEIVDEIWGNGEA